MKKILFVVTNISHYKNAELPTGLWLSELTHFYDLAKEKGYDTIIASPKGGKTPIDPESLKPLMTDKMSKRYLENPEFMNVLNNTKSLGELKTETFDCIYLTGGHGTMYDFPNDENLQEILRKHFENGKIVSAICHGVGGLLNVKLTDGSYMINGKELTGYSWTEEILARRNKEVPFDLEESLKKNGAIYKKALIPLTSKVCEDKNLITGQNPFSSKETAKVLMERLSAF